MRLEYRGVEQLEARRAHNPEVVGSSPASATKKDSQPYGWLSFLAMAGLEEGGLAIRQGKQVSGGHLLSPGKSP